MKFCQGYSLVLYWLQSLDFLITRIYLNFVPVFNILFFFILFLFWFSKIFHLKYFVLISENLKCEGCIKCQSLLRRIKFQTKIKTLTIQIDKVANDSGNNESVWISINAFWMVCDWTVIYLLSTRWACRQLFCSIKLDIYVEV